jgi:hypothetical protein
MALRQAVLEFREEIIQKKKKRQENNYKKPQSLESVPSSTELNSNEMALNDQKQEAQGANKQEILEFLSGEDDLTEKNIDMIC